MAHQRLGIDAALGAWGGWRQGPGLVDPCAGAVAIDAAGGAVGEGARRGASGQRAHQGQGAGVAPPLRLALGRGRRRHVDDAGGQAGQSAQAGGDVEVTRQRRDASASQQGGALGAGGERQQAHAAGLGLGHAQAHITATDDQEAFAAKARGQGAEGALV